MKEKLYNLLWRIFKPVIKPIYKFNAARINDKLRIHDGVLNKAIGTSEVESLLKSDNDRITNLSGDGE